MSAQWQCSGSVPVRSRAILLTRCVRARVSRRGAGWDLDASSTCATRSSLIWIVGCSSSRTGSGGCVSRPALLYVPIATMVLDFRPFARRRWRCGCQGRRSEHQGCARVEAPSSDCGRRKQNAEVQDGSAYWCGSQLLGARASALFNCGAGRPTTDMLAVAELDRKKMEDKLERRQMKPS